jgi:hypothetical protein
MNSKRILGVILGITLLTTLGAAASMKSADYLQSADAFIDQEGNFKDEKAPPAITGDNVYVTWWTDKGMPNNNSEVIFRASTDGGATFGNKTNLSNTTDTIH